MVRALTGQWEPSVNMANSPLQQVVSAPTRILARPVALWGGGAALLAISIAWNRGVMESSVFGVLTVISTALVGFGVLSALHPRPIAKWAIPVLLAQMVRTMLAPAAGIAVMLLTDVDALGYFLSLLAVACAMLVGETIAVAKMFGSAARDTAPKAGQEAVA